MIPLYLPNRHFMQMCWVVPDLEAAMAAWTKTAGVGPFFLFERLEFGDPHYRGKPAASPDISAAMAQAGDIQVELVCQHDDSTSFWRDIVPAGRTGLHHLALYSRDYEGDVAAYTGAGAEVAFSGLMMGNPVCWIDTGPQMGFMVEIINANETADAVFAQFRAAAADWDGSDPVRTLS